MEKKLLQIPNGCCELVIQNNGEPKQNCFKVSRTIQMESEPKLNEPIQILMGSGFIYNGEIYHKSIDYLYIYLY